jgi:hypothetical protein
LKLPFAVEGYGIFFGRGDFLGRFRGGAGMAALPSETDEPESNKSSASAKAQVASLPPAEVENVFLPAILTLVGEAFSVMLSLEDCATNFVLGFKGLARASSYAEVSILEWDDPFPHLCFSKAFLGARADVVAADLRFRTMGLGRHW